MSLLKISGRWPLLRLLAFLFVALTSPAQTPLPEASQKFDRTEVMIAMRDGVRLQTVVFTPKERQGPLPILLTRTPYDVPVDERNLVNPNGPYFDLVRDGYIFVTQNIRGRFKSEGTFAMQRPPRDRRDAKSTDEATDAYDTIEWLLRNVPYNNGRVGMFGVSYSGWTTAMALLEPHPALKAVSEQASPADMLLFDDFAHGGAFRLSYGLEYSAMVEAEKGSNFHFKFDKYDTYEWYLRLGALSNVNSKYFHGEIPTWNGFVEHPNHDAYWKQRALVSFLSHATVPNLNVGGWWDQEDRAGPQKIYETLERNDRERFNHLVIGPWNHGGWAHDAGDTLGKIPFDSDTAGYYRKEIQAPWFAHWLHGRGTLRQPEVMTFQTGANQWKSYDSWPPKSVTSRKLYFRSSGRLSFDPPDEKTGPVFDSYISDPANPVPYRPRPIIPTYPGPDWPVWMVQDQRFVEHRPDVLTWQTEPLKEDVTVTGNIVTELFASTSGTDSDWIVKLIDVYPEDYPVKRRDGGRMEEYNLGGYQLMIAGEVLRSRFRNSFEFPEPLTADQILQYRIDLQPVIMFFERAIRSWFKSRAHGSRLLIGIHRHTSSTFSKLPIATTERRYRRYSEITRQPLAWCCPLQTE